MGNLVAVHFRLCCNTDSEDYQKVKRRTGIVKSYSDAAFNDLARFCQKHSGAKRDLCGRISRAIAGPVNYNHLCRWLDAKPEKRIQPQMGWGILLIQHGQKLMEDWKKEGRA